MKKPIQLINGLTLIVRQNQIAVLLGITTLLASLIIHLSGFDVWISEQIVLMAKNNYIIDLSWQLFQRITFDTFVNPFFYIPAFIILSLEYIIPAKSQQNIFSLGIAQDFIWFFLSPFVEILLLFPYSKLLQSFLDSNFEVLKIHALDGVPKPILLLIGIIVFDFTLYITHFMMHKVPFLWNCHSLHHSQKNLNMFTEYRFHIVDNLMMYSMLSISMYIFNVSMPTYLSFWFIRKWYLRLYHSNIKTNFGVLKYLVVTPQSHRVHHSNEERHFDKNFGNMLSIWDYMFKTQYTKYDEYPDTGVDDLNFPVEQKLKFGDLLRNCWIQMSYPFQKTMRSLNKKIS